MTNEVTQDKESLIKKVQRKKTPIFWTGLIAYMIVQLVKSAGGMILPSLITDYALTAAQSALFVATLNYVYSFAALPVGILTDTIGAKLTAGISYLFIALGSIIFAFSDNFTMLLIARGLTGLGIAAVYPAYSKILVAWERSKDYPAINGRIMGLAKFGTLLAATPLALMITGIGRRNSMLIIACATALITIGIFIFFVNKPSDVGLKTIDELEGNPTPVGKKSASPFAGMGKLFIQPQVWLLVITTIGINSALNTIIANWGATMMTKAMGFSIVNAGNIISIQTICAILGAFLVGHLIKAKGLKFTINVTFVMFGVPMIIMALFLPKLNFIIMAIFFALFGLAGTAAISSLFSISRNIVTNKLYGTMIGLINFVCWLFGAGIATQIWAVFIDESYSAAGFQKAIWFQFALLAICFVCFIFVKDKTIDAFKEEQ